MHAYQPSECLKETLSEPISEDADARRPDEEEVGLEIEVERVSAHERTAASESPEQMPELPERMQDRAGVAAASAAPEDASPITLTSYVLSDPPHLTITTELRQYTASDQAQCAAAAGLKSAAQAARSAAAAPAPAPGTVTPLLATVLAPAAPGSPHGMRIAAALAALAAQPSTSQLRQRAPIARCGMHNVLGNALHAVALGACMDPQEFMPIVAAMLEAGVPADLPLVLCPVEAAASVDAPTLARRPLRSNSANARAVATSGPDSTHWLHGATVMHLVTLFGLHHGRSMLPLLETLRHAGACMCVPLPACDAVPLLAHACASRLHMHEPPASLALRCRDCKLHGATPLHLACAQLGPALPDVAADVVQLLSSRRSLSRALGSFRNGAYVADAVPDVLQTLLAVEEAVPLEVAVAAPGDADHVVQALVATGADISGCNGARAVLLALTLGKRMRATTLLKAQVRCCTLC
jgi:hypothetical protein